MNSTSRTPVEDIKGFKKYLTSASTSLQFVAEVDAAGEGVGVFLSQRSDLG